MRRSARIGIALCVGGFVAMNAVALVHAHAFTHFTGPGARTMPPEKLTRAQKVKVLATGVRLPKPTDAGDPRSVLGLAFETIRIPVENGVELEAWRINRENARGTIVLFHGYAASKSSVLAEAKEFHDLGWEPLLVDFRGSGGSSTTITTAGVLEAADVAAAMKVGGDGSAIYAKSMGSAAVLRAAKTHGVEASTVILECPFDSLLTTVERRFGAMGVPAFPFAQLLVFWGGAQHGFSGFGHRPVDFAASLESPALLMHGEKDKRVSLDEARSIHDRLAGKKEFVIFEGLGHESYLSAQPDRWREAVRTFLARDRT